MSMIYLTEACRLKSYSASTKGEKSTIKIEIDVGDHHDLGFLLRELAEIETEQKAKDKPQRKPTATKAPTQLALPSPLRQLPYYGAKKGADE